MAMWQEEIREQTHLWKMYQRGMEYQAVCGMRHKIPEFINFYEGRQWPLPTENTKNLPRPVVNIVKMICRSKKSSILSTPVRILYKSYAQSDSTDKLNSFAQSLLKEINQDGLDRLAIDDGIKKGSYFYHYYWDPCAVSLTGRIEGGVRCEIIDPLNIFFENPRELDEQKQKWILISTQMEKQDVYNLCQKELMSALFLDENDNESEGKITVLTRYFRIDGEVWCERGTKYSILTSPFKIAPSKNEVVDLLGQDFGLTGSGITHSEELSSADNGACNSKICPSPTSSEESKNRESYAVLSFGKKPSTKASLYPIVCGYYERKEGSIYGISEVEGIIPNQKAINFNVAMSLLNAQQCAWGKYIALPNALKGQKISNAPGQVLIDHSGTGNGIKKMADASLSQVPMELVETITALTRTCTGASEILSSEAISSNLSGVAIAQLQAQAEVPIEELRSTFWEVKRKQGVVLAQFIRLYYSDKEFIRQGRDENGNRCEICDRFSSKDYENSVFDVVVEPIRGTRASISSDINMLNSCLSSGKISLETYIRAYPDGAISNKTSILKQIEEEKESEINRLRKELEMYKNRKTLDPVSIV